MEKLAADYFLEGTVSKFPLKKSKHQKYVPGTCLNLQGPFNNVFSALKEYFQRWGNLNTHICDLQGLTKLNQVASEFKTLPSTENDSVSEDSFEEKLLIEPIPHKDPLPHFDFDKAFTEWFLKACKIERSCSDSETEIKEYLVERSHK